MANQRQADPSAGIDTQASIESIGKQLVELGWRLAVMESCTGGLLSTAITCTPGSGDYFLGGAVSYATSSKVLFGIEPSVIECHGVISSETAVAMAQTAALKLEADCGLGLTGVAGPEPQEGQPVGRVFIAAVIPGRTEWRRFDFGASDPDAIKAASVDAAVDLLGEMLRDLTLD